MAFEILDYYLKDPTHMPTREILNDLPPWPNDASEQFLGTNELTVISLECRDRDDPTEDIYFFTKLNGEAFWGKQQYPPCVNYPSSCSTSMMKLKDYWPKPKVIQDIPFQEHRAYIVISHASYVCPNCNKRWWPKGFSFVDEKFQMTNRLVALINRLSFSKRTFQSITNDTRVEYTTLRKVFLRECKRRHDLPVQAPEHIGIDEAYIHTKKEDHKYICIMDTGPNAAHNGVLNFHLDQLTQAGAVKLLETLANPQNVKTVTMDMSKTFHAAVEEVMPDARIIIDRFHVVQSLHNKIKETVARLYAATKKDLEAALKIAPSATPTFDDDSNDVFDMAKDMTEEYLLDGTSIVGKTALYPRTFSGAPDAATRYDILLKNYHPRWFVTNPNNLKGYSLPRFEKLLQTFPEFENLYLLKEQLRYYFYEAESPEEALKIAKAAEAMLPPIPRGVKAADDVYAPMRVYFKTLLKSNMSEHIFEYFKEPKGERLTNAKLESMNKMVKEVNAAARGLSIEVLLSKIMFGNLSEREMYKLNIDSDDSLATARYMCFCNGIQFSGDAPATIIKKQKASLRKFIEAFSDQYKEGNSAFLRLSEDDWFGVCAAVAARDNKAIPCNTIEVVQKIRAGFTEGTISAMLIEKFITLVRNELEMLDEFPDDLSSIKVEVREPFLFDTWEAHKDEYLAMVADDSYFLEYGENLDE